MEWKSYRIVSLSDKRGMKNSRFTMRSHQATQMNLNECKGITVMQRTSFSRTSSVFLTVRCQIKVVHLAEMIPNIRLVDISKPEKKIRREDCLLWEN